MSHFRLTCPKCGMERPADMSPEACTDCGSPLDVKYSSNVRNPSEMPTPLHDFKSRLTLGEGNTPLTELTTIGGELPLRKLYAKLEFLNPTGSFKDRGTATMLSVALEHGVSELVEDSSGTVSYTHLTLPTKA